LTDYRQVIKTDSALRMFLSKVKDFDHIFSQEMAKGADFTVRLEVRGCNHRLIHVRLYRDSIDRPPDEKSE